MRVIDFMPSFQILAVMQRHINQMQKGSRGHHFMDCLPTKKTLIV